MTNAAYGSATWKARDVLHISNTLATCDNPGHTEPGIKTKLAKLLKQGLFLGRQSTPTAPAIEAC